MGTYSYEEFLELFGGPPEPGEAYPSLEQIDNLRKAQKEHGPHHLGASKPETPVERSDAPPRDRSAGTSYADGHCDVCGAPVGKHHLSYCDLRGDA